MLYPYHLSDIMVKGLRVTPFSYYTGIMEVSAKLWWEMVYYVLEMSVLTLACMQDSVRWSVCFWVGTANKLQLLDNYLYLLFFFFLPLYLHKPFKNWTLSCGVRWNSCLGPSFFWSSKFVIVHLKLLVKGISHSVWLIKQREFCLKKKTNKKTKQQPTQLNNKEHHICTVVFFFRNGTWPYQNFFYEY